MRAVSWATIQLASALTSLGAVVFALAGTWPALLGSVETGSLPQVAWLISLPLALLALLLVPRTIDAKGTAGKAWFPSILLAGVSVLLWILGGLSVSLGG